MLLDDMEDLVFAKMSKERILEELLYKYMSIEMRMEFFSDLINQYDLDLE